MDLLRNKRDRIGLEGLLPAKRAKLSPSKEGDIAERILQAPKPLQGAGSSHLNGLVAKAKKGKQTVSLEDNHLHTMIRLLQVTQGFSAQQLMFLEKVQKGELLSVQKSCNLEDSHVNTAACLAAIFSDHLDIAGWLLEETHCDPFEKIDLIIKKEPSENVIKMLMRHVKPKDNWSITKLLNFSVARNYRGALVCAMHSLRIHPLNGVRYILHMGLCEATLIHLMKNVEISRHIDILRCLFLFAVRNNYKEAVKFMLCRQNFDPTFANNRALTEAYKSEHGNIIKLLR